MTSNYQAKSIAIPVQLGLRDTPFKDKRAHSPRETKVAWTNIEDHRYVPTTE